MTNGGPEPTDPYPATPRPQGLKAQKSATPAEPRKASVVPVLVGAGIGIGLVLIDDLAPAGPPLWQSVVAPLLLVAVMIGRATRRNRKVRAAMDASEAALHAPGPPVAVRLLPRWGGAPPKVTNRFAVHAYPAGDLLGYVTMMIDPTLFDPRDELWLRGRAEAGGAVALQAGDERAPMLTAGPFETDATLEPMTVHPKSDLVNRLLGWDGSRIDVPVAATGHVAIGPARSRLPAELAEPADRAVRRMGISTLVSFVAPLLLVPLAAVLHLSLGVSSAITVALFVGLVLWTRYGFRPWSAHPVAEALRQVEGLDADDARFVAQALLLARFGLPAPRFGARAAPPAEVANEVEAPLPPGWGYPPR